MFNNVYLDSWAIADNTAILSIVVIAIAFAIGAVAVVVNAIRGIAIYKMTKQQKYSLAFLSFIPFAQGFVLGRLADSFKKKSLGKISINRFLLPLTTLAKWIAYIVFAMKISDFIKDFALLCNDYPDWIPIVKGFEALGSYVIPFVIVLGVFVALSFVNHIFFSIAIHRVFAECKATTAAVMTALSFMFGAFMSLAMLFVACSKDKKVKSSAFRVSEEAQKSEAYF